MASCYGGVEVRPPFPSTHPPHPPTNLSTPHTQQQGAPSANDGRLGGDALSYLPLRTCLKDGSVVEVDFYRERYGT